MGWKRNEGRREENCMEAKRSRHGEREGAIRTKERGELHGGKENPTILEELTFTLKAGGGGGGRRKNPKMSSPKRDKNESISRYRQMLSV